jgi:hypothetical protein
MPDTTTASIALIAFAVIMGAWEVFRRWRAPRTWKRRNRRRAEHRAPALRVVKPTVASAQLDIVMTATFAPRRIMSRGEAAVFYAAERALKRLDVKGRVMAQVSLGEILSSSDEAAYRAVNSKRVDILLISNSGLPLAAIEYQGEGHYQGTAHARDAVKRAALQRAGIAYIETTPRHDADDLERDIARALGVTPQMA